MLIVDITPVPPIDIDCTGELVAESIADLSVAWKVRDLWCLKFVGRRPDLPMIEVHEISVFPNVNLNIRRVEYSI